MKFFLLLRRDGNVRDFMLALLKRAWIDERSFFFGVCRSTAPTTPPMTAEAGAGSALTPPSPPPPPRVCIADSAAADTSVGTAAASSSSSSSSLSSSFALRADPTDRGDSRPPPLPPPPPPPPPPPGGPLTLAAGARHMFDLLMRMRGWSTNGRAKRLSAQRRGHTHTSTEAAPRPLVRGGLLPSAVCLLPLSLPCLCPSVSAVWSVLWHAAVVPAARRMAAAEQQTDGRPVERGNSEQGAKRTGDTTQACTALNASQRIETSHSMKQRRAQRSARRRLRQRSWETTVHERVAWTHHGIAVHRSDRALASLRGWRRVTELISLLLIPCLLRVCARLLPTPSLPISPHCSLGLSRRAERSLLCERSGIEVE